MKLFAPLSIFAIVIAALVGWVLNIVGLVNMVGDINITAMFVARVVGVFFFPLGAVLGYF